MPLQTNSEVVRSTLAVLFIGGLLLASVWILRPFLAAFIWAVMIVVATWRPMLRLQALMWGRRNLAVTVITLTLLLGLVVPLTLGVAAIAGHAEEAVNWFKGLSDFHMPPPPDWLQRLPLIGDWSAATWNRIGTVDARDFVSDVQPYAAPAARWLLANVGSVSLVFVQFLLTLILTAVLYMQGENWAAWLRSFGRQLASGYGENAVLLAGQAIRGVALGVVVTAAVQSALGGLGLALAGVPFAGGLTALMFMLCIAQLGPILVMLPATGWLFWSGETGWGSVMLVWSIIVGTMDNFLRPYLIRQGADLPLMLIFAGVVGGLLSFGLLGLFVGPVLLAVGYTLLDAWVKDARAE